MSVSKSGTVVVMANAGGNASESDKCEGFDGKDFLLIAGKMGSCPCSKCARSMLSRN